MLKFQSLILDNFPKHPILAAVESLAPQSLRDVISAGKAELREATVLEVLRLDRFIPVNSHTYILDDWCIIRLCCTNTDPLFIITGDIRGQAHQSMTVGIEAMDLRTQQAVTARDVTYGLGHHLQGVPRAHQIQNLTAALQYWGFQEILGSPNWMVSMIQ